MGWRIIFIVNIDAEFKMQCGDIIKLIWVQHLHIIV